MCTWLWCMRTCVRGGWVCAQISLDVCILVCMCACVHVYMCTCVHMFVCVCGVCMCLRGVCMCVRGVCARVCVWYRGTHRGGASANGIGGRCKCSWVVCVTWCISNECHDSFVCVTWRISNVCHASCVCDWLVSTWHVTALGVGMNALELYLWHDVFQMCAMTRLYASWRISNSCHYSFVCDMTPLHVTHNESCRVDIDLRGYSTLGPVPRNGASELIIDITRLGMSDVE